MPSQTVSTPLDLLTAVKTFRNLAKQVEVIHWFQASTGEQKQQNFAQRWRNSTENSAIDFVDVFKYYTGDAHQDLALQWLQENSQPATLTEFLRRWNQASVTKIDRTVFFNKFSVAKADQPHYEIVFDYWEASPYTDRRWLAYALATAYHETGKEMRPLREGFASTDEKAIDAVTRYCQRVGRSNYALPDPVTGKSYFGRGLVQITFADNYKRVGQAIGMGLELYQNPTLALDPLVSVKIMIRGMADGLFTSHKLADFFNDSKTDWFNARDIINGDKNLMPEWANGARIGDLIASYAKKFYACLQ